MSEDKAPGHEQRSSPRKALTSYLVGLVLATLFTLASFALPGSELVWPPALPFALAALAIGQMGIHLAFFLHITTGPDNANNILALAFGVLIVGLVLIGSMWIMDHLNANMMVNMMMPNAAE